ncbi:hypothetical protein [Streptobacillus moniliformis]|uniref:hypothetical protein n=1 Tax=Streptobacillus moniliformis TaxID=34105 RepID=UPI0007E42DED|nr:hypothetical protein [Streptobacillus moniliformis]
MKKEVNELITTLELIIYDQTIEKISLDLIDKSVEVDQDEIKIFIVTELIKLYDKYSLHFQKIKLLKFLSFNNIINNNFPYMVQLFFILDTYKPEMYQEDLNKIFEIIKDKNQEELFFIEISNIYFQNKSFELADLYANKIEAKKDDSIYLNALYNRIFSNYHLNKIELMNYLHEDANKFFDMKNEIILKNEFALNIIIKNYSKAFEIVNELSEKTKNYNYQIQAYILSIILDKKKYMAKYTSIFTSVDKSKFIEDINSSISVLEFSNTEAIKIFNVIDNIPFKFN